MLQIPKEPLPDTLLELLEQPGWVKVVGTVDGEGAPFLEAADSLVSLNGRTLVLSQRLERSPGNKNLVRSIWRDLPVTVLLRRGPQAYQLRCRAYRCLIAGQIFQAMLLRAREQHGPDGDITAVWELIPESWTDVSEQALLERQEALDPHYGSHLDRASILAEG